MDRLEQFHSWATFVVSIAIITFFTLSVGLLSYGVSALALLSSVLVLTGIYCFYIYLLKKTLPDFLLMSILNFSLVSGFLPQIGMKYMQIGVIGPYLWLSLVTINMAYSMVMIIFYDMRISKMLPSR
ncbi:MAG: hypothetical protein HYT71_04225 [Candidatus Aenigmarchaeota archaeon]|nr:hypothetical protein [Candidatus Aenigmarchaeota archaeon]